MPVVLYTGDKCRFVKPNGELTLNDNDALIVSSFDFDDCFMKLCGRSVYSNSDSLKNGYLTLSSGCRVGVCMSAVTENGEVISVKDAVSLNIRIPREVKGCSDELCKALFSSGIKSVIVASEVSGGKTTLLRDIARNLSDTMYKVTVIDERNEIAAKSASTVTADVGKNTDVLTGFSKLKGIETAVRVLSPDVIILDEVASESEARAISNAFACGVRFILSVHAGSVSELRRKEIFKKLCKTNEFSALIFIDKSFEYKAYEIKDGEINENIGRDNDNRFVCDERLVSYKNCS